MPKVMMISGAKALGGGDIGARGRVPVAGAYRSPIGRLIGHANLGAVHEGSADAIRAGLMLPLLRGAGIGAMRSLNYPSAALRGVGLGDAAQDRRIATGIADLSKQGCLILCTAASMSFQERQVCTGVCNAAYLLAIAPINAATDPGPGSPGDPTAAETERRRLELERWRAELDGQSWGGGGSYPYNAPPPAPAAAGVPNWVYYAGAAAGIGLLAYAVLGGKRRR